jgi:hypothetical protein
MVVLGSNGPCSRHPAYVQNHFLGCWRHGFIGNQFRDTNRTMGCVYMSLSLSVYNISLPLPLWVQTSEHLLFYATQGQMDSENTSHDQIREETKRNPVKAIRSDKQTNKQSCTCGCGVTHWIHGTWWDWWMRDHDNSNNSKPIYVYYTPMHHHLWKSSPSHMKKAWSFYAAATDNSKEFYSSSHVCCWWPNTRINHLLLLLLWVVLIISNCVARSTQKQMLSLSLFELIDW